MVTKLIINGKEETFQEAFEREYAEKMKSMPKRDTTIPEVDMSKWNDEKYELYLKNKEADKKRFQKVKPRALQTPEQEAFNNDDDF